MRLSPARLLASLCLAALPSLVIAQGNPGAPCIANDGSSTGTSDECDTYKSPIVRDPFSTLTSYSRFTAYCRRNTCSSFPSRQVGESCNRDTECVGAETFAEIPTYCAPAGRGTSKTCGGGTAYCYAIDGRVTGPSPTCASGTCTH